MEAHLAHCKGCVEEHVALEGVRRMQHWEPPTLSEPARERTRRTTIEQAIIAPARARTRDWVYVAAALLAAATTLVAYFTH